MAQSRMLFVDNVRLALIGLVVFVHALVTYSRVGGWYYYDPAPAGPLSLLTFIFLEGFCQSFFMGALFCLAGYYCAAGLARKGRGEFIKGRLVRLGLPALLYMALINPLTVYLANPGGLRDKLSLLGYFQIYLVELKILSGSGPMWFALALLIFSICYALFWPRPGLATEASQAPGLGFLAVLILVCASGSFAVRQFMPIGRTVLNMQLGYFTQYILLFGFGIAAYSRNWLAWLNWRASRKLLAAAGLSWLAWAWLLLSGAAGNLNLLTGGPHWQSLAYASWESVSGICATLGLVGLARQKFDAQSALVAGLSDCAFAVYVFHPPVMVWLAQLLEPWQTASLAKALVLCALSLPACFGVAWLLRRAPVLRDLLRQ